LGDAAGDLIVAPFIVLWSRDPGPGPLRDRPLEALLLAASVLAIGATVFGGVFSPGVPRYPSTSSASRRCCGPRSDSVRARRAR